MSQLMHQAAFPTVFIKVFAHQILRKAGFCEFNCSTITFTIEQRIILLSGWIRIHLNSTVLFEGDWLTMFGHMFWCSVASPWQAPPWIPWSHCSFGYCWQSSDMLLRDPGLFTRKFEGLPVHLMSQKSVWSPDWDGGEKDCWMDIEEIWRVSMSFPTISSRSWHCQSCVRDSVLLFGNQAWQMFHDWRVRPPVLAILQEAAEQEAAMKAAPEGCWIWRNRPVFPCFFPNLLKMAF